LGGINKSLIEIEGVQIITRTVSLLQPLFSEIILAGWPSDEAYPDGTRIVADNFPDMGPLAGIEAAMKASVTPWLFVLGGDMPWLSGEIISDQAADFLQKPSDVLVVRIGRTIEPLHAVYRCSLHSYLQSYLQAGNNQAVREFFRPLQVRYYDLPGDKKTLKSFSNINTPQDLL
jgi:molybdopterin-guanine dinucleotide biosynthesis protein A